MHVTPPTPAHPADERASGPADARLARFASGGRGLFDITLAVFCGLLLISNVAATKLIEFTGVPLIGSILTDGGAFLFPLTYVLGDVLAEVYGLRKAARAIWTGFALAALMSVCFFAVGLTPPAASWSLHEGWDAAASQSAWTSVLGFVPRIVVASLAGYLVGQFINAWVVVRAKERTGEGSLWFRLVSSTIVGEFADTLTFCTIAFGPWGAWLGGGSIGLAELVNYTLIGWIYKCLVEICCLPLTYRVIAWFKRREPDYA